MDHYESSAIVPQNQAQKIASSSSRGAVIKSAAGFQPEDAVVMNHAASTSPFAAHSEFDGHVPPAGEEFQPSAIHGQTEGRLLAGDEPIMAGIHSRKSAEDREYDLHKNKLDPLIRSSKGAALMLSSASLRIS